MWWAARPEQEAERPHSTRPCKPVSDNWLTHFSKDYHLALVCIYGQGGEKKGREEKILKHLLWPTQTTVKTQCPPGVFAADSWRRREESEVTKSTQI